MRNPEGGFVAKAERNPELRAKGLALKKEIELLFSENEPA